MKLRHLSFVALDVPLTVSEHFYSIQGEGKSVGVPAVFLRLTGCNLTCSGWSYEFNGEHLGCDSKHVWRKGTKFSPAVLLAEFATKDYLYYLSNGAHLIITGGEPLLQISGIVSFLVELRRVVPELFVEVETNGTIMPTNLFAYTQQFNVSPKLSNSGDPEEKRITIALDAYVRHPLAWFKFVAKDRSDFDEIESLVNERAIRRQRVWVMPEATSREQLNERSGLVAELCKEYQFHYSDRLHIRLWGDVTGV